MELECLVVILLVFVLWKVGTIKVKQAMAQFVACDRLNF
jgi:hypothetical protein